MTTQKINEFIQTYSIILATIYELAKLIIFVNFNILIIFLVLLSAGLVAGMVRYMISN